MGIFTRFKDIVNANINHLLDKAEDPEKMIRLMIHEMEETLVDLKRNCAEQLTLQAKASKEQKDLEEQAGRWETRARLAVSKGKDDLAKEALYHLNQCREKLKVFGADVQSLERNVAELKNQIGKIGEKLAEVKSKRMILSQRAKTARDLRRSNDVLQRSAEESIYSFSELEERAARWEAEAESSTLGRAQGSEDEFKELEREGLLEAQLEALKKDMGSTQEEGKSAMIEQTSSEQQA